MLRAILKRRIKDLHSGFEGEQVYTLDFDAEALEKELRRGGFGESGYEAIDVIGIEHIREAADLGISDGWLVSIGYEYDTNYARFRHTGNDIELWERDDGQWQVCTPDSNGNAIKLALFTTQKQLATLLEVLAFYRIQPPNNCVGSKRKRGFNG